MNCRELEMLGWGFKLEPAFQGGCGYNQPAWPLNVSYGAEAPCTRQLEVGMGKIWS